MSAQPCGLFFCVDGGGTRSRAKLLDPEGGLLAAGLSGPCNPSTDQARALASLNELWDQCRAAAGGLAGVTLAIGAAGLYVPQTRAAFLAACPAFGGAVAMTDGYAALIGAGGGNPSALIIWGTGVAGHRLYADGRSIQRDAWGWVAGDRGSGAWLGRKALRHCFAVRDGVVAPTSLSHAVWEAIGGGKAIEAGWLRGLTPDRLGALAPLVLREAEAGEPRAVAIRARAVEHLAALAVVLDAAAVPLYAAGGIAEVLRAPLAARLGRPVLDPEADAMTGCFLVASGRAPAEQADFFGTAEPA
jgi:glucosamine kinase